MNNELKIINKKIRFLNEIIPLNELFKEKSKRHIATELHQQRQFELVISKYRAELPLGTSIFQMIKPFMFFGEQTKEIKRVVKNDELISIEVIEEGTESKFPLSAYEFKKMISRIKFI